MKYCIFLFAVVFIACNNQGTGTDKYTALSPEKLSKEQIPAGINFPGNLHEAWQWIDRSGEHVLLTAVLSPYTGKEMNEEDEEEEGATAALYIFHYLKKDGKYTLLWKKEDGEKACPFDLTVEFIKNAISITDLDSNGIAETTVLYKLACRSDVSPAEMILLMHEDTTAYSLQGNMWIFDGSNGEFTVTENDASLEQLTASEDELERMYQRYGRYKSDLAFANAPASFLSFARKQWLKHAIEHFE